MSVRLKDFLDRLVDMPSDDLNIDKDIDYIAIQKNISEWVESSRNCLKTSLKEFNDN